MTNSIYFKIYTMLFLCMFNDIWVTCITSQSLINNQYIIYSGTKQHWEMSLFIYLPASCEILCSKLLTGLSPDSNYKQKHPLFNRLTYFLVNVNHQMNLTRLVVFSLLCREIIYKSYIQYWYCEFWKGYWVLEYLNFYYYFLTTC